MDNYLQLLDESLIRKMDILEHIEQCNKEQEEILLAPEVSMELFEGTIDQKGQLIDELNDLDAGFEQLYDRIREQIQNNRDAYKAQIAGLQTKIRQVTEKSVSIQAQEQRNKRLAEAYFAGEKNKVRSVRKGSKAAMDYYKSMSGGSVMTSRVMDRKK